MAITTNLPQCNVKAFTDLASFCLTEPEEGREPHCEISSMVANGQKNMFVLMGKFSDVSTLITQFPPETASASFEMGLQVGNDFGSVIRVVTDFKEEDLE